MSFSALVGSLLLALASEVATVATPEDLAAYESARARTGRDAGAHIRLALWCERRGLEAERIRHLALAVLIDPGNVRARGLLGLVNHAGKWESPAKVGARIRADQALAARLAGYNTRRDALDGDLRATSPAQARRAHVKLGLWCEQNGLKAEATAHFTSAVVLNPQDETAWKHLGHVKHNGRWMSPEQVDAEQREEALQKDANRRWEPLLRKWRSMLAVAGTRTEAEDRLAKVDDPRAVPAIVRVLVRATKPDHDRAVPMLGRIDSPGSTWELARLAVLSASGATRRAAIEALRPRNRRDYAGRLVAMIRAPIQYHYEPPREPGSTGYLATETPGLRLIRTYDYNVPPLFVLKPDFNGHVTRDPGSGMPLALNPKQAWVIGSPWTVNQVWNHETRKALGGIQSRAARNLAIWQYNVLSTFQRMAADVQEVEAANLSSFALNERVGTVLQDAAGAPDLKDDEDAWHTWWYNEVGSAYQRPPVISQVTIVNATPPQIPPPMYGFSYSCFAPGTLVRTRDGHRPIETLRVGDQVLGQDVTTGALSFQPILVVHRNPQNKVLRVALDNGETLSPSVYHRFWRAGAGWALARELREGDLLRALGGLTRVVSVSDAPTEPLFNLDVDGGRTFFVGQHDTLVHDNSLPSPQPEPFDTVAEPVVTSRSGG